MFFSRRLNDQLLAQHLYIFPTRFSTICLIHHGALPLFGPTVRLPSHFIFDSGNLDDETSLPEFTDVALFHPIHNSPHVRQSTPIAVELEPSPVTPVLNYKICQCNLRGRLKTFWEDWNRSTFWISNITTACKECWSRIRDLIIFWVNFSANVHPHVTSSFASSSVYKLDEF